MDMELITLLMVTNTKDNIVMENLGAEESIHGLQEQLMKENSKKDISMEKVNGRNAK